MQTYRFLPRFLVLVVIGAVLCGCSRGPSEEEVKKAQLEEQYTSIQQLNTDLEQTRSELAQARSRLAELEAIPANRLSDEQKDEMATIQARIEELQAAQDTTFDELQAKLADFLNLALNEFPEAEETIKGLEIYSKEAVGYANDAVTQAGDYKKAIDHLYGAVGYYEAIGAEPYPPLKARLEELEEQRYITKERFEAVKNGMTKEEVKEAVGTPYYANIREDKQKGVEMWLYPKREGGAAGVYFRMKTEKVYGKNFDAVKPQVSG
jgi:hypothetical protein